MEDYGSERDYLIETNCRTKYKERESNFKATYDHESSRSDFWRELKLNFERRLSSTY